MGQLATALAVIVDAKVKQDRLIDAAPELLAMLEAIVGQAQPNRYGYDAASVALDDEWRASARAAIARAR